LITELGEALSKLEGLNLSILLFNLIRNLIGSFSSKPLISPVIENKTAFWMALVIAFLQRRYEVVESGVLPGIFLEIDLESITEGLPTHEVDQLLKQASPFSVGDAIYQRL